MMRDLKTAEAYLNAGNARAAAEHVRRHLAQQGESRPALVVLAQAELGQGDNAAAAGTARRLLALDPGDAFAYQVLGCIELRRGKPHKARKFLDQAIECDPSHVWSYMERAAIARHLPGGHHDALRDYETALRLDPDNAQALAGCGLCLILSGRRGEGEAMLRRAGAAAPDDPVVLVARGRAALLAGRLDEARDFALWALRLNARDRDALALLCSFKAARYPVLGMWWRLSVSFLFAGMALLAPLAAREPPKGWRLWGVAGAIGLAVGFFVLVLLPRALELLPMGVWLPVVLVIDVLVLFPLLVGPWLLEYMVRRELKAVKLRPDF